jgi:hypothetical protein
MSETGKPASSANEPFVPRSDRPEVKPDARIADLTVRDLLSVLRGSDTFKPNDPVFKHKDFLTDSLKTHLSKFEYAKSEYFKLEHPKPEVWEVWGPQFPAGPDPRFAEITQGIAGLAAQVHKLSSEVAELRKHERG